MTEHEEEEQGDEALTNVQATAEIQLQELQQARDRVFQAAIQREARQVAALIAAAPPLVPSPSDPGLNETASSMSSVTNPPDVTEHEEEEEEQGDEALTNVQATAEIQLQELQQARDRVFQAAIQREARQVAALIAAAPPLVPSPSDPGLNETASSVTNPPVVTEHEEEERGDEALTNVQATAEIQLQELQRGKRPGLPSCHTKGGSTGSCTDRCRPTIGVLTIGPRSQ